MKRFTAKLNDGNGMDIQADRLETTVEEDALFIYKEGKLVGYVKLSEVISARLRTVVSVYRREWGEKRERVTF